MYYELTAVTLSHAVCFHRATVQFDKVFDQSQTDAEPALRAFQRAINLSEHFEYLRQQFGRNPDAAAQIRATFIIGAAFAEGLGVLAVVVGILAIFLG